MRVAFFALLCLMGMAILSCEEENPNLDRSEDAPLYARAFNEADLQLTRSVGEIAENVDTDGFVIASRLRAVDPLLETYLDAIRVLSPPRQLEADHNAFVDAAQDLRTSYRELAVVAETTPWPAAIEASETSRVALAARAATAASCQTIAATALDQGVELTCPDFFTR